MASSKVLDLSFQDIDVHELGNKNEMEIDMENQQKMPPSASALRLSSNGMTDVSELFVESAHVVKDPEQLRWLDLSCNSISTVPEDFTQFREMMVIYLHGNRISDFHHLLPLGKIPNLKKLTLHGNPVEDLPNYRSFVILMIPTLRMLDFSIVTKQDRTMAEFFRSAFNSYIARKLRSKKKE